MIQLMAKILNDCDKDGDKVMWLYSWYCMQADKANKADIWVADTYTATGLGWGLSEVKRVKRLCKRHGYITVAQKRDWRGYMADAVITVNYDICKNTNVYPRSEIWGADKVTACAGLVNNMQKHQCLSKVGNTVDGVSDRNKRRVRVRVRVREELKEEVVYLPSKTRGGSFRKLPPPHLLRIRKSTGEEVADYNFGAEIEEKTGEGEKLFAEIQKCKVNDGFNGLGDNMHEVLTDYEAEAVRTWLKTAQNIA